MGSGVPARAIVRRVARSVTLLLALFAAFGWAAACGSTSVTGKGRPDGGSQGDSGETGGSGGRSGATGGSGGGSGEKDGGDGAPPSGHIVNRFVDFIISGSVQKVDLLLMVDNSISMADKQRVF